MLSSYFNVGLFSVLDIIQSFIYITLSYIDFDTSCNIQVSGRKLTEYCNAPIDIEIQYKILYFFILYMYV